QLWSDGWSEKIIRNYFNKYYNRFYLFDERYPFYQVANLLSKEDDQKLGMEYSPIVKLILDKASGNNPTLWDHNTDDQKNFISLSTAVRWLVTQQTFNLGGTKSDPKDRTSSDAPTARNMHILIHGKNLFETLMYNLCIYNIEAGKPLKINDQFLDDKPCWEQDLGFESHQKQVLGYLDYMTWQPCWLKLKYNTTNPDKVQEVLIGNGYRFKLPSEDILWPDPLCMYYKKNDKTAKKNKTGWGTYSIKRDRAVWRDLDAMFVSNVQSSGNSGLKANEIIHPAAFNLFGNLLKDGYDLPQINLLSFHIYGIAPESGHNKVYLWRHEIYSVPLEFLTKSDETETALLISNFKKCIKETEYISKALIRSLRILTAEDKDDETNSTNSIKGKNSSKEGDPEENQRLFRNALSVYWAHLSLTVHELLRNLPENRQQAIIEWENEVKKAAFNALNYASQGYENSGQSLKQVALAEIELCKSF
ncbi:MAG: type I-E CRISPR-associated protein Cse1/CasA, partial [Bacteroidota bacterium]